MKKLKHRMVRKVTPVMVGKWCKCPAVAMSLFTLTPGARDQMPN